MLLIMAILSSSLVNASTFKFDDGDKVEFIDEDKGMCEGVVYSRFLNPYSGKIYYKVIANCRKYGGELKTYDTTEIESDLKRKL